MFNTIINILVILTTYFQSSSSFALKAEVNYWAICPQLTGRALKPLLGDLPKYLLL